MLTTTVKSTVEDYHEKIADIIAKLNRDLHAKAARAGMVLMEEPRVTNTETAPERMFRNEVTFTAIALAVKLDSGDEEE